MEITCKMNGGENLKWISSQKIFSIGITCKMNWEIFTSDFLTKKNIWELLVNWTQIKCKGKNNEKREK